ncbi:PfkB family carbohydrate kinase [Marisediminicola sp. UYEF4]|uniref:carbohydrate kinase family protein n=1 Tax=Marisediminicola sp. UYEF4 TaxID=1756384 RepID=UPI003397C90C
MSAPDPASAGLPGRIVVFGDVIDDIVVVPQEPVRPDTDTSSSIRHRAGGSAANVAAWLGSLGAPVDLVGMVGVDDVDRHTAGLAAFGVRALIDGHPELPTGTIVVIVDGERRTMLTERGANSLLDPRRVTDELLDDAVVLHLTGYSMVDAPDAAALEDLVRRATLRGVAVSVDPASAGYIVDFGVPRFLDAMSGATLVFPNLDEGRALTGESDPLEVAASLGRRFRVVALTLGPDGAIVVQDGGAPVCIPAVRSRILDPTGAGDAFCAGFLAAWAMVPDAVAAATAGVQVAERAVTSIGGRPRAQVR